MPGTMARKEGRLDNLLVVQLRMGPCFKFLTQRKTNGDVTH